MHDVYPSFLGANHVFIVTNRKVYHLINKSGFIGGDFSLCVDVVDSFLIRSLLGEADF